MNALKRINKLGNLDNEKEMKKLNELTRNKKYPISQIKKIKHKFGISVLVELEIYKVWLPKRASELSQAEIDDLNKGYKALIYTGEKKCNDKSFSNFQIEEIEEIDEINEI
jgi:hypothetical protein